MRVADAEIEEVRHRLADQHGDLMALSQAVATPPADHAAPEGTTSETLCAAQ
jgi:hypothetical protein